MKFEDCGCKCEKEDLEERVICANKGCDSIIRKDTKYRVNGKPYCRSCYGFEKDVK